MKWSFNSWHFETLVVEINGASFELFKLDNLNVERKWTYSIFKNGFILPPHRRSAGGKIGAVPEISAERIQVSIQVRQSQPLGCKIRSPKWISTTSPESEREWRNVTSRTDEVDDETAVAVPSRRLVEESFSIRRSNRLECGGDTAGVGVRVAEVENRRKVTRLGRHNHNL